jgi:AraC-like DNA-binding protein
MANAALLRVDSAFGGVEWLHARYTSHVFDLHAHEEFVIAIVDEGAEAFQCSGKAYVAAAGTIYTINPDEPHDGRAAGSSWRYRAFYPSVDVVRLALGVCEAPRFSHTVLSDEHSVRTLARLHEVLVSTDCALERESAITVTLQTLFNVNGGTVALPRVSVTSRGVKIAYDALRERSAQPHSLTSLATEAGLHPNYLLCAFKQRYGATPAVFLRSERLKRAKELMRARWPLIAVAQETGFYDQAHFSRHFKRAFGVTPSAFIAASNRP